MAVHCRWSLARSLLLLAIVALLAAPASAVTFDWVLVGDPGNAPDTASNCGSVDCGSVAYDYFISKYEVTNAQYAEFLNSKAVADPLALYTTMMGSSVQGGITRSGSSGSYTYAVKPGFADKPVNYVSFWDALRFANWLNNGQGSGDTETGAYTLLGGTPVPDHTDTVTRNPGAMTFLTSGNEWYKAAYFDGTSYFDYPAGSNAMTMCTGPGATPNRANCDAPGSDATDADVDGVTDVGSFTASASPAGTFDQGGNVWEWCEEMSGPNEVGYRYRRTRGGGWGDEPNYLAASDPINVDPLYEDEDFGFRVARLVPEPRTSLLGMTGLAALARVRGRSRAARAALPARGL